LPGIYRNTVFSVVLQSSLRLTLERASMQVWPGYSLLADPRFYFDIPKNTNENFQKKQAEQDQVK
jgi:hypothetical protein